MGDGKTFCSYEQEPFDDDDFDEFGEHRGQKPRHLLTGVLIRKGRDGPAPLDVVDMKRPTP